MSNALTPPANMDRDRQARVGPIDAARQSPDYAARSSRSHAVQKDASGFWDDRDGTWKNYFRAGISKVGGGDVLK